MSFHEVRFPTKISFGSTGGPGRRTDIAELASGFEERNTAWSRSRHRYDVAYGIKSMNALHEVIAFFEARRGKLYGFRYKDWSDYKSCPPDNAVTPLDQVIGTGTGTATTFQLVKAYTSGGQTYTREINKPVSGTVRIAVNDVELTSGWSINTATGVVTFTSAPANGHSIKAGFEFDVPVRFDADDLMIDLSEFRLGSVSSIPLVEVRV